MRLQKVGRHYGLISHKGNLSLKRFCSSCSRVKCLALTQCLLIVNTGGRKKSRKDVWNEVLESVETYIWRKFLKILEKLSKRSFI